MLAWRRKEPLPVPAPPASIAIPFVATTVGASVDSFYRSAMNSVLNASLTNQKSSLFPNMHIQMPIRIVYINGIKNLRYYLDTQKPALLEKIGDKNIVKYGVAIAPGVLMTPFSSLLEASNAGHMNSEAMSRRWTRGLTPRMVREVIFAVGLNQVSDVCEDAVPNSLVDSKPLRSVVGSILAGCAAGYLSHVPHNISSLKLLQPNVTYMQHIQTLRSKAIQGRFEEGVVSKMPVLRGVISTCLMFLMPRGVMIRTGQIVGSFILVNGSIALFSKTDIDRQAQAYAHSMIYGMPKSVKA